MPNAAPQPAAQSVAKPVALVTGASNGMGRVIAQELAATHRLIIVGRDPQRLADVAQRTGAEAWQLDVVADAADLGTRVAGLDRLDTIVHAAAIARPFSVATAPQREWAEHFAVNVTAPAVLTGHAIDLLRVSQGTVVFIGSGASTAPAPGNSVYASTKHALKAVADGLRIEEEPNRVRVVTVAPGPTDTDMLRGLIPADIYSPDRYIQPESVARAVRFAIDAGEDVQITDLAVRPRAEITRG